MPRAQTPTIGECIDRYMKSKAHMAPTTIQNEGACLKRFASCVGAHRPIGYLTPAQVEKFFTTKLAGHQASSVNKERQRIGGFFRYCERHGWIRYDLLAEIKKRPVPHVDRLRLAPAPLCGLLDIPTDPRNRGFLAVCINTGLRASELARMQIKDADLDTDEIYVYRSKTRRDDYLPMTTTLRVEIRRWLTAYANERGEPLQPDMYLFPARKPPVYMPGKDANGKQNKQPYGAINPYARLRQSGKIVKEVLVKSGIGDVKYQGVHTIRRSVARAYFDSLADNGYDNALRSTMAMLGHTQTSTTEHYIGLDRDRRRRDATLRDHDFLPFGQSANVVPLRAVGESK